MKRRLIGYRTLVVVLIALLATLTSAWARSTGALGQLDLLLDVRHEIVSHYVESPDQEEMTEAAVRGMVDSLEDPYTTYLSQDDLSGFERTVTGKFTGIGAEVDMYEDRLRIVSPLEDSPAWHAGIMAGDVVLQIEGEDTLGLSLNEAVDQLTGEAGTDVDLTVRHPSGEEAQITITRDVIEIQTVRGFRRDAEQHFDFLLTTGEPKIGYIRLTQFNENTASELRQTIEQLLDRDIQGLILDLRFNPGGLLESAVAVSDLFLPEGDEIVSVQGRVVPEQSSQATADTPVPADLPVVVIANGASASAAEIVTGALKDNDRALVIGSRTFGKGSVQQVRALPQATGAIKLTTAYYYIPSGRKIHRTEDAEQWGVDPTDGQYIPMDPEEIREMVETRRESEVLRSSNGENGHPDVTPAWIRENLSDPQLAAALEAVQGRVSGSDWPTVGRSNAEALVEASERQNLMRQRELLQERLSEVEQELAEVGKPLAGNTDGNASAAEATSAIEQTPDDIAEDVTPEARRQMEDGEPANRNGEEPQSSDGSGSEPASSSSGSEAQTEAAGSEAQAQPATP